MGFYEITEQILNQAFTENGDKAYVSTGSKCLDYFSLIGGMRFNLKDSLTLFMKSYYEDPILTIKILFYTRDIRAGLGERNLFRYTFNALANMYPDVARQLLAYIPVYGRYDDLLVCLETPLKKDVLEMINKQLKEDIENKKNGKNISLLAKWLPSINTSSNEAKLLASILAASLGMKKEEYRKTLSFLRKGLIVENNLREKDYTFEYENLPGGALFKYRDAFQENDTKRYNEFISKLREGKTQANTNTLYPYQIIRKLEYGVYKQEELDSLDAIWKSFDRSKIDSKTIVVRDGSGSMYDSMPVSASSVATSLAILFAEQLTGSFKNKFITFSSNPKLVSILGNTISEKFKFIEQYSEIADTNIERVYKLILNVYQSPSFNPEDALDRIVIISDMEFNQAVNSNNSTFENFKTDFEELGFKMPEVVFWNVRARHITLPTVNEKGVKLVSGASQRIIEMITQNKGDDAYQFMLECLERYSCFDKIKI